MIDEAETIGERGCRDHSHPVVRLRLNEPKSAEGKALLSLLQSTPEEEFVPPVGGFPTVAASGRTGESLAAQHCLDYCKGLTGQALWDCRAACLVGPGGSWLAPIARQAGQLGVADECYEDCIREWPWWWCAIRCMDPVTREVRVAGRRVELANKEFGGTEAEDRLAKPF
jgi:hypothetical protein